MKKRVKLETGECAIKFTKDGTVVYHYGPPPEDREQTVENSVMIGLFLVLAMKHAPSTIQKAVIAGEDYFKKATGRIKEASLKSEDEGEFAKEFKEAVEKTDE